MSGTLEERKYNSLKEVIDSIDEKDWWDLRIEEIEYTEENRQIVEDGLFWCGVECARYTYNRVFLYSFIDSLECIKDLWNRRVGENHENDT